MTIKDIEDHKRLDIVADQLLVDQHDALAQAYGVRQALAATAHRRLVLLGQQVKSYAAAGLDNAVVGKRIADWLTDEGWTPPAPLEIKPDEDEDEADA